MGYHWLVRLGKRFSYSYRSLCAANGIACGFSKTVKLIGSAMIGLGSSTYYTCYAYFNLSLASASCSAGPDAEHERFLRHGAGSQLIDERGR